MQLAVVDKWATCLALDDLNFTDLLLEDDGWVADVAVETIELLDGLVGEHPC